MTVSGLTTIKHSRHLCQTCESHAQNNRSVHRSREWGRVRAKMASCWRRARFSRANSVRSLNMDLREAVRKKTALIMDTELATTR